MVKVGRMRKANRFLLMAGILAVVASGADASLWHHKKDAPSSAAADAKAVNADPAAMSLTSVDLDGTHVVLHTTGTPAYTSYSPSPDVFVVDLSSTGKAADLKMPAAYPNGLASVTAENAVEMGTRLTRVTFRLTQPMNPTASAGDNAVVVTLPAMEAAKIEQPAPAPAPEQIAAKPADTPAEPPHVEPPVEVAAEPAVKSMPIEPAPVVTSEALPLPKAKKLKDVATQGSAIRITGDGELTYKSFQLTGPDRVVLDISGVRNAVARKNITVNDSVVKRVRIGQFSPDVIRVVMDLDSRTSYDVARQGESLVVTFGGAAAPAAPQVIAQATPPPAPKIETPAPKFETPAPTPAQVPVIAENAPTWKMPERASKGAKAVITAPAQSAPAPTTKRTTRNLTAPATGSGAAASANPGATVGTVKSRLTRARQALRHDLGEARIA